MVRSSWVSLMPEWQWGDSFQHKETPFAPGDPSSMEELVGGLLSPRQQEEEQIFPGPFLSSCAPRRRSIPVWLAPAPV